MGVREHILKLMIFLLVEFQLFFFVFFFLGGGGGGGGGAKASHSVLLC